MEKLKYILINKYENYQLLYNKIKNPNYLIKESMPFLSNELQNFHHHLVEIKANILKNNNKPFSQELNKMEYYNILVELQKLQENNEIKNFFVNNNENPLKDGINKLIDLTAREIHSGSLNIDNFIGVFKVVNLILEMKNIIDSEHKMNGLQEGVFTERVNQYIYGQGFEDLNKIFLSEQLNIDFKSIPSLNYWDYKNSKRQYETWTKNNGDIKSWDKWYFDKSISVKDRFNIPSMDLEGINPNNNKIVYVENKNFNINRSGTFSFNLRFPPEEVLHRLSKQESLRKYNCELFYNINIYDRNNNDSYHYYIPIEDIKKIYNKIDKQITMEIKKQERSNNKNKHLKFTINISDTPIDIELKYNVKGKDIVIDSKSFHINFKNHDDFNELFSKHKLNTQSINFSIDR